MTKSKHILQVAVETRKFYWMMPLFQLESK